MDKNRLRRYRVRIAEQYEAFDSLSDLLEEFDIDAALEVHNAKMRLGDALWAIDKRLEAEDD